MTLTTIEKATIILFNEGEQEASIYTYNANLRTQLALCIKKHPELCRMERSFDQGGVFYSPGGVYPSNCPLQRRTPSEGQ